MEVTIGTEDDESFLDRAQLGDWLPRSWVRIFSPEELEWPPFWDHPAHIPFQDGISVPLPGLLPTQQCQVHFVVAWAPHNEEVSGAWMATHVPSSQILFGAGCK